MNDLTDTIESFLRGEIKLDEAYNQVCCSEFDMSYDDFLIAIDNYEWNHK